MADNKIRVYQNNNKTVICTVSGLDITGYTPYLTAKKNNAAGPYANYGGAGGGGGGGTVIVYYRSTTGSGIGTLQADGGAAGSNSGGGGTAASAGSSGLTMSCQI